MTFDVCSLFLPVSSASCTQNRLSLLHVSLVHRARACVRAHLCVVFWFPNVSPTSLVNVMSSSYQYPFASRSTSFMLYVCLTVIHGTSSSVLSSVVVTYCR